jgi:hypothetical protein
MDTLQFFLEQHSMVRTIVENMVLRDLSDDQLRRPPGDGQNSLAWLLWHSAAGKTLRWRCWMSRGGRCSSKTTGWGV